MKKKILPPCSVSATPIKPTVQLGKLVLSETDLCSHLITFGGIGSCKTAAVTYPLVNALTKVYSSKAGRLDWGGLLLDNDGNSHESLLTILQQQGRKMTDVVLLTNDSDYALLEFSEVTTGNSFFVSASGARQERDSDAVLSAVELREFTTQQPNGRISVLLSAGNKIPLRDCSLTDPNLIRNDEFLSKVQQLVFNVANLDINWIGWAKNGKESLNPLTKAAEVATRVRPQRVKYVGTHLIDRGVKFNTLPAQATAYVAANNIIEANCKAFRGSETQYFLAAERHITNCIALHRSTEGPLGAECSINDVLKLVRAETYLQGFVGKLRGVCRDQELRGTDAYALSQLRTIENYFKDEWFKRDSDYRHTVGLLVTALLQEGSWDRSAYQTYSRPSTFEFAECVNAGKVVLFAGNGSEFSNFVADRLTHDYLQTLQAHQQKEDPQNRRFQFLLQRNSIRYTSQMTDGIRLGLSIYSEVSSVGDFSRKQSEYATDAILNSISTKLFLGNQDRQTNEYAKYLLSGEADNRLVTTNFPQLIPHSAVACRVGNPSVLLNLASSSYVLAPKVICEVVNAYYKLKIEERIQSLGITDLLYKPGNLDRFKHSLGTENLRSWINGRPILPILPPNKWEAELEEESLDVVGDDEHVGSSAPELLTVTTEEVQKFLRFFYPDDGWSEDMSYKYSWERFKTGAPVKPETFQIPLAMFGKFGTERALQNMERQKVQLGEWFTTVCSPNPTQVKPKQNRILANLENITQEVKAEGQTTEEVLWTPKPSSGEEDAIYKELAAIAKPKHNRIIGNLENITQEVNTDGQATAEVLWTPKPAEEHSGSDVFLKETPQAPIQNAADIMRILPEAYPAELEVGDGMLGPVLDVLPFVLEGYKADKIHQVAILLQLKAEMSYRSKLLQSPEEQTKTLPWQAADVRWSFKLQQTFQHLQSFEELTKSWTLGATYGEIYALKVFLTSKDVPRDQREARYNPEFALFECFSSYKPSAFAMAFLQKFTTKLEWVTKNLRNQPGWAYHLLVHFPNLTQEQKDRLYTNLTSANGLPWTLQYIHDINLPEKQQRELTELATKNCKNAKIVELVR